jgi:hypothetical protein
MGNNLAHSSNGTLENCRHYRRLFLCSMRLLAVVVLTLQFFSCGWISCILLEVIRQLIC